METALPNRQTVEHTPTAALARGRSTASRLLTETQIKGARAVGNPLKLVDQGGLFLLIQPAGSKLWRYRFKLNGKEGLLALGKYPDISLKRARELHLEARKLVASGKNPVHDRQNARLKTTLTGFAKLSAEWQETSGAGLRKATVDQRRRELAKYLVPRFGTRDANSITRPEIAQWLTGLSRRVPETARNLRTHLNAIFEYGIDIGLVTSNPTPPPRVLVARNSKHHASLPATRLGNLLRDLTASKTNPETKAAMLMVLLTAARKNEVTGARWSEINFRENVWVIPAARMKGKREHWVPLSRQAVELLRDMQTRTGSSEHVFPNRIDPKRPMANRTLNALITRLGYAGETTPHGLRSSFSTYFNKLGSSVDVIEHCLAHAPADRVRAAYNRHRYQDERREMLQLWADYLDPVEKKVVNDA